MSKTWELVNFCEIDQYAARSYSAIHNVPVDKNLGDITRVDAHTLKDFTMICGGSPCQDFSVAGNQAGSVWKCRDCGHTYNPLTVHHTKRGMCPKCNSVAIDKTRSSLLVEFLRIVKAKKPEFGLYENVKNIVGKKFKATFDMFEAELNEYGYNTYWQVLNAKDYGIPQNRERVYVIFIRKDMDMGGFVFPEPFDNGVRLIDILEPSVEESYYVSKDKVQDLLSRVKNLDSLLLDTNYMVQEGKVRGYDEYAPCLSARDYKSPRLINENKVKQVGNIVHTGNWSNPYKGRIYSPKGLSPTLSCMMGGGLTPKILQVGKLSTSQDSVVVSPYGIAPTHTAGHGNCPKILQTPRGFNKGGLHEECPTLSSHSWEHNNFLIDTMRIRKLTPKECFRLMGFSDKDWQAAKDTGISNSQLYKQAGNSIVVNVLYYIFRNLYAVMPYLFDDLTLASFFSGIGAFEVALDRLYEGINTQNFRMPSVS